MSALTLADGVVFGGSLDATIRVWSTRTWEHVDTLVGHASGIYALTVVGDDVLCSASGDTVIQVWCITTHARLRALTGHTRAVLALCAGRRNELVSGSHDKTGVVPHHWDSAAAPGGARFERLLCGRSARWHCFHWIDRSDHQGVAGQRYWHRRGRCSGAGATANTHAPRQREHDRVGGERRWDTLLGTWDRYADPRLVTVLSSVRYKGSDQSERTCSAVCYEKRGAPMKHACR